MRIRRALIGLLAGAAVSAPAAADTLCLGPSEANGILGTVDCTAPVPFLLETKWIGFAETEEEHCEDCVHHSGYVCLGWDVCAWTISASDTDPFVNVAPLPDDGRLHLWYVQGSTPSPGFSAAEFGIGGTLVWRDFEMLNGGLWLPEAMPDLLLAVPGCPAPPRLVGRFLVERPSPVDRSTWGRTKAIYR